MKKGNTVIVLILIVAMLLSACGGANTGGNVTNTPNASVNNGQKEPEETTTPVSSPTPEIKTLTIPNMSDEEVTQEEVDKEVKEKGWISGKLNEDNSITYQMNKEQYDEMVGEMVKSFEETLQQYCDEYDDITDINHNDDFSKFQVMIIGNEISLEARIIVLGLVLETGFYSLVAGTTTDKCIVEYINNTTGEVIEIWDSSEAEDEGNDNDEEPSKAPAENKVISDNEIVLVDDEKVTVKVTSIYIDPIWGYTTKFYLENKTELTLVYSINEAGVNDFLCDPFWAKEVAPGKKAYSEVNWGTDDLPIKTVEKIAFMLRVYDNNDWLADDILCKSFSLFPEGEYSYVPYDSTSAKRTIVNNDKIEIYIMESAKESFVYAYEMQLYINNKTDKTLIFTTDDVAVNGFMCDPFWSKEIPAGMRAFTSIGWSKSSLTENGISSVEEIEFVIRAYDSDNWLADDIYKEKVVFKP